MAGTPGIDAGLPGAAGRRCDGYSMVIRRRAISLQKEIQTSLGRDLDAGAVAAMDGAREMPPGDERTEAIHKAMVFRNAAEIHRLLGHKRGAPDL